MTSLSQLQLLSANYLLRVRPRLPPYLIFKESSIHIKHVLREAPETPGLNSTWQGNVFSEYAHQKGAWRRRLPGRTIAFSSTLLWLARSEHDPEWPGNIERLGSSPGWQLWLLSLNEQMSRSWEALERWFTYRLISIAPQRQSLEVLSPLLAITANAQYVVPVGKQVLLGCYPPARTVEGLDKRAFLTAELMERSGSSIEMLSRDPTLPFPADQVSYFRWTPLQLGEYRFRIQGDASTDPLLICVVNQPPVQPRWLCGLTCTIASLEKRQTFQAFSDLSGSGPGHVVQIEREELPAVTWTLEPEQLPIRVIWNVHPQHEASENTSLVRSGDELMQCWQDYILPALANKHQTKMVLDAGSYGRVELSIVISQLAQAEQTEQVPLFDERVISQVIWLSRMIGSGHQHKYVPIPIAIQHTLQNLHKQVDTDSPGSKALARLSRAKTLPAWVCFRLGALLAEVQEQGERTGIPETNDMQEEVVV